MPGSSARLLCPWSSPGKNTGVGNHSLLQGIFQTQGLNLSLFPGGSDGKESACSAGDLGMIPGSGRSPGEGNGYPLQYSCLENSMERGAWWATVQGVTKSQTRLTYRYTDMRDTRTHTVSKQCAYTDTRMYSKTNTEHLGRSHKERHFMYFA